MKKSLVLNLPSTHYSMTTFSKPQPGLGFRVKPDPSLVEREWHFLHHFRRGPSRGQGCDFDAPSAIRSPQNHYHLGFAFLGSDPQKWLNFFYSPPQSPSFSHYRVGIQIRNMKIVFNIYGTWSGVG